MKKIIDYVNENPGCSYRDVITNTDPNAYFLISDLVQNGELIEVRYHLENQHSERTGLLFPKNTSVIIVDQKLNNK